MAPEVEIRDFPPLETAPERPEKLSQSSLSKLDTCPRSAYLYFRYGGGIGSAAMAAGSAFHAWAEKVIKHMAANDMSEFPPDVGRDWMSVVLSEHKELVVPESQHDALRQMCWNFCEAFVFFPSFLIACEEMWEAEVSGWKIRGRIDLAETEVSGVARVTDWKTSFHLPPQEEVAKGFQGRLYAFLIAQGAPEGQERELAPLARVSFSQVFPRYTDSETGEMISRGFEMDANELADFRRSLELLVERAEHGFETGEWPAQAGSHCSRCPAPVECPIPDHLNPHLPLPDERSAQEAASLSMDFDRRRKALEAAQKEWVKENGSFMCGDLECGFDLTESRTLDKEALDRALQSQEPVDVDELYKVRHASRFGKRKVSSKTNRNGGSE